jgi:hypothetical protein
LNLVVELSSQNPANDWLRTMKLEIASARAYGNAVRRLN